MVNRTEGRQGDRVESQRSKTKICSGVDSFDDNDIAKFMTLHDPRCWIDARYTSIPSVWYEPS